MSTAADSIPAVAYGRVPTTGATGGEWRADVTPAGAVEPWDGSAPLAWYVAADDRWHDPATDSGVRHRRIDGTAVFETKVRVPSGDAVQRIWSVPDRGGMTLVEIANDSALPIAVAFTRPDLLTGRPPTDVPIQGIDLPAGTIVVPIGHRTTVTVALAHRPSAGPLPAGLPTAEAVVRGWVTRSDAASRLVLPDPSLVELVRATRCETLLGGNGDRARSGDDAARYLLLVGELVRLAEIDGRACDELAPEIADAVAVVARESGPLAAAALDAAGLALAAADERRALSDLTRIRATAIDDAVAVTPDDGDIATVAAVERRLAAGPVLLPHGVPAPWLGQDLEAHGLVTGPSSRLSLAMRWHGENVAVLWEVDGDPVELTSGVDPSWRSTARAGEALWRLAPA
jgi:hypothetical protein